MNRIAYVGDKFVPLDEAKISVLDRGFLFADGVYEVSAVIDGLLVDNAAHLARLERSLAELRIEQPMPMDQLVLQQKQLVRLNNLDEGLIYLQVTRGTADREFGFPTDTKPNLVMFTQEKPVVDFEAVRTGISVVSTPDIRWQRRDIKSTSLLAQVLSKQVAVEAGAGEAWMVEEDYVTEGSSSSAYIVTHDNVLVTRPVSNKILAGITRQALLQLAQEKGLRIEERQFTIEEAQQAKEAFISSATTCVLAVVEVDGKPVGTGKPGAFVKQLREIYLDFARATSD